MLLKPRVAGDTSRRTYQLTEDGDNLVATGFAVSDLLITGNDGTVVDTAGRFNWVSAPAGTVYYDPVADSEVATKSPYRLRVKVTDGGGKVRYYPSGAPAEYVVRPAR